MLLVSNLIQSVLSYSEVRLRRDWLLDYLRRLEVAESAALLDALCRSSERGEPEAREALAPWVAGLVAIHDSSWVTTLRLQVTEQHLPSLGRMLRQYGRLTSAPAAEPPVPDYGSGRELTVGERRSLARQPNRRAFEKLLRDPHPLVLRNLLGNPRLTENDVLRLAARRPLQDTVIEELAKRPDWLLRPRVRMTILHNPYARSHVAMALIVLCKRDELLEIFENTSLHPALRHCARELLDRRPPFGPVPITTLQ